MALPILVADRFLGALKAGNDKLVNRNQLQLALFTANTVHRAKTVGRGTANLGENLVTEKFEMGDDGIPFLPSIDAIIAPLGSSPLPYNVFDEQSLPILKDFVGEPISQDEYLSVRAVATELGNLLR